MNSTLQTLKLAVAALSAGLSYLFGGLDMLLFALLILMGLDYITGVLCGAIREQLSSRVGFRGIVKKVCILCVVALAHLVGRVVSLPEVRSFVIGFYIANEGISILENAGTLGVPLPARLKNILEQLKEE